jgi:hypothetical protein
MLLLGLLRGFLGDTGAVIGVGGLVLIIFLALWLTMLHEVERA